MDVTSVAWRKSSYSGDSIEVGTTGPAITVRDSKHPNGPQLAFASATWHRAPACSGLTLLLCDM